MTDPRITKLGELAASKGIIRPIPPRKILWFDDHGCVVNLCTDMTHWLTMGTPTLSTRAVTYLLCDVDGEVSL